MKIKSFKYPFVLALVGCVGACAPSNKKSPTPTTTTPSGSVSITLDGQSYSKSFSNATSMTLAWSATGVDETTCQVTSGTGQSFTYSLKQTTVTPALNSSMTYSITCLDSQSRQEVNSSVTAQYQPASDLISITINNETAYTFTSEVDAVLQWSYPSSVNSCSISSSPSTQAFTYTDMRATIRPKQTTIYSITCSSSDGTNYGVKSVTATSNMSGSASSGGVIGTISTIADVIGSILGIVNKQ